MLTDIDQGPIVDPDALRAVGVVGLGQMGSGIAHTAAVHGFEVLAVERDAARVRAGLARVRQSLDRAVATGHLTQAARDAALHRLHPAPDFAGVHACDIVVEAVSEDEPTKRHALQALVPHLRADAVVVTNTSAISITRLASVTDRPGRVMGMHFMNPAPAMAFVERIRGITTQDRTDRVVRAFAAQLGKTAVLAEDFPGFIVNRLLMPMINEAVYALYEGVAGVAAIDTGMRLGANHPMGPLELADYIGLDTCLGVMTVLHEGLADTKYRPCPLLMKYCEAGWLGRKTGRGFYDYRADPPTPTR